MRPVHLAAHRHTEGRKSQEGRSLVPTEYYRARLENLRSAAAQRVQSSRNDVDAILDAASSTTGDDEHDPEGATIGFERAQAMALRGQAEEQLVAIDAALGRLADGTYGVCERCGRPIAAERLEARPAATRCIACAGR